MHKSICCEILSIPCVAHKYIPKSLVLSFFSSGREKTVSINHKVNQSSRGEVAKPATALSNMVGCWPTEPFD